MTIDERSSGVEGGDMDRDARLDRLYREAALEEPPAHLDAAILAAARREAGARPRSLASTLRKWRVPVSIAAVVVLSASLVTLVKEEGGEPLLSSPPGVPFALQLPQPEAAKEAAHSPYAAPAPGRPGAQDDGRSKPPVGARAMEDRVRQDGAPPVTTSSGAERSPEVAGKGGPPQQFQFAPDEARGRPTAPPAADSPASAPAVSAERSVPSTAASPAQEATRAPTEPVQRQAAPAEAAKLLAKPAPRLERDATSGETAGAASGMKPQAAPAPAERSRPKPEARLQKSERLFASGIPTAALLKELESQPPEKWLERIEELKREGKTGEADAVLAEFRRRFPQHPVPPGLQAK
jgi:hypothetical protein